MVSYLEQKPEYKKKLLDEILPVVKAASDDIVNKLDYDTVMEFDYLHNCFYESLRIEAPAGMTGTQCFNADVTFATGFKIAKGEPFVLNIHQMHHDPDQWIDPSSYEPDRFDPTSKWAKRPNGEPRDPMTFTPFLGGRRGCLGKTFAEVVVRYVVPIMYYHFDFELVDPEMKVKKVPYSIATRTPEIPVRLIKRN